MSTISESVRERGRQRVDNRCEYCLSPQVLVMGRLQIDHVLPLAKGGSNAEDNLCLACELCNQYKWTKTEAVDPKTGATVPLFNPRYQAWHDHFDWSENGVEVLGKSACGRATIVALRLNKSASKSRPS